MGGESVKGRWMAVLAALGSVMLLANARPLYAQDSLSAAKEHDPMGR